MKIKKLIGIVLLILLAIISFFYLTIKKNYVALKEVNNTEECVRRHFINKDLWKKCMPGVFINDSTFNFNNSQYTVTNVMLNGFHLKLNKDNNDLYCLVYTDRNPQTGKATISISTFKNNSNNILNKYSYSQLIKKNTSNIDQLLNHLENYFNNQKNVYGFDVKMERTSDFYLLVSNRTYKQMPTQNEIYNTIEKINAYILQKKGEVKNPPMLNITQLGPGEINVMIAVPTKHEVEGNSEFAFKQLVEGNILTVEVKGGLHSIKQAENELKNYVQDTKKVSPAIPYQSLITNRITETDTAKWITKLYYPVFF